MKIFLIKTIVIFSLLCSFADVKACAGGGEEEYGPYLFLPDFLTDSVYLRYFPAYPYYDNVEDLLRMGIVEEWSVQFTQCDKKDIEAALFNLKPEIIESLRGKVNPVPGNGFLNILINENREDIIDYLEFIISENNLTIQENFYSWEDVKRDNQAATDLINKAKARTADFLKYPFLQQKYMYQVIKLLIYNESYTDAITFYESNVGEKFTKNLTYFRTLGYYAGALRKSKQEVKAKYLFAKIFDKCPAIRHIAYKNFKYIDLADESEWKKSLALASDESERSAFWIIQNIYDDNINVLALKELYKNDPASGRLQLALLKQMNHFYADYMAALKKDIPLDSSKLFRKVVLFTEGNAINVEVKESKNWFQRVWESIVVFFKRLFGAKEEEEQVHHSILDEEPQVEIKPFKLDEPWVGEFVELLEKINEEGKVKNKELFKLALGFAYTAQGEFSKGNEILFQLTSSSNIKMKDLAEYLMIWGELAGSSKLNPELEEKVVHYFQKNKKETGTVQNSNITFANFNQDLKEELGRRYLVEKQYYKAMVILGSRSRMETYCSFKILEALMKEAEHPGDAKFHNCFGQLENKELKEIYANRLLLLGRFKEAAAMQDNTLWFDPSLKEYERITVKFSDLAALEKKGDKESYLKIADYLSHSGTWGYNAIPCYNYYYEFEGPSSYPFNVSNLAETMENRSNVNLRLNYSTELVERYYRKAFDLTSSKEKKAEILFMAQAVAMKDKYALRYQYSDQNKIPKNYYYKELADHFADTDFYKNAYNSCSFLRQGDITYY